jgi:hypothetical protein
MLRTGWDSKLSERYDIILTKEEAQDPRGTLIHGIDIGMVTELFPSQAKSASPKHPKSPSRSSASPSPAGRRKRRSRPDIGVTKPARSGVQPV